MEKEGLIVAGFVSTLLEILALVARAMYALAPNVVSTLLEILVSLRCKTEETICKHVSFNPS